MQFLTSILIPLTTFAIASGLSFHLSGLKSRGSILDHPNARSLHRQPIPRTGGLAVLAGIQSASW
jgi:UDP-N-acetylmuramyl pentapeptide phosphotransferase/UDP-N-acetylglucosamine-1-phosphate transferase